MWCHKIILCLHSFNTEGRGHKRFSPSADEFEKSLLVSKSAHTSFLHSDAQTSKWSNIKQNTFFLFTGGRLETWTFRLSFHPAHCWTKCAQPFNVPAVHVSQPVCVDVPSTTEAVLGESMKLTCIACMRREEIKARTRVDWYYMPQKEKNVPPNKTHVGSSYIIVYGMTCGMCVHTSECISCMPACLSSLLDIEVWGWNSCWIGRTIKGPSEVEWEPGLARPLHSNHQSHL